MSGDPFDVLIALSSRTMVFFLWGLVGMVLVRISLLAWDTRRERQEMREQLRRASEAKALRRAEVLRGHIAALDQICLEARASASPLREVLRAADADVVRASGTGNHETFLTAAAAAAAKLAAFNDVLIRIDEFKSAHNEQAASLGTDAPAFSLGEAGLPDPEPTYARIHALLARANWDLVRFPNLHRALGITATAATRQVEKGRALIDHILGQDGPADSTDDDSSKDNETSGAFMTQRDKLRDLYARHGNNPAVLIREYAKAERRGEVTRTSNAYGISAETYARALVSDAYRKGWL